MTDIESAPSLPPPQVWGPWATIAWAALIVVLMVVTQALVFLVFIVMTATGKESPDQIGQLVRSLASDGLFLSVATFSTTLVCSAVIIGIVKLKRGSRLKPYLGLTGPNGSQLLRWTVVTMAFCVAFDVISVLLKRATMPEFMTKAYASIGSPWILWLAVIVAGPLFEELFFRGFIIKGLAESRLRWQGAVLISSGLWSLIHLQYNHYELVFVFILGLILGVARVKTGSTLLTLLLHSLVNLAATIEVAVSLRGS
jgi:membrane protease YdiL (CAAX protease family)